MMFREGQFHIPALPRGKWAGNRSANCLLLLLPSLIMCGSTHVVAYIFEVPRDQLHLLRSIVLEPFQRTELCLLVPPCLSSSAVHTCADMLGCMCRQCSSRCWQPAQQRGLAAQAKRKVSALARQRQQLQSVTSIHVTAANNAKAAVAAADRSQSGQLELLVAKAETVCRHARPHQARQQLQASCSSCSLQSSPAASFFLYAHFYFPSRLHLSLQSLELLLEGDCCHCCQPSRVTDEHR